MMTKFKIKKKLLILVILTVIGVIIFTREYPARHAENVPEDGDVKTLALEKPQEFVLAVVVCGLRTQEALVMIKSAIVFKSTMLLKLIVLTEDSLKKTFEEKLNDWVALTNETFSYEIHPVSFPAAHEREWKQLFKLCAAQRLFFPDLLPQIDSLLYVDTDTLFVTPLTNVWKYFSLMNSTQFAALAPEHEDPNVGWYNRFAQHPFYGKLGVNSGVMLMNLTRMRSMGWTKYLAPIFQEFKHKLTWGDQDIINVIFHYHPECLYVYPCSYNFRPDHCMYGSVCQDAEKNGVNVIHGSRSTFQMKKQLAFRAVYQAFQELSLPKLLANDGALLKPSTSPSDLRYIQTKWKKRLLTYKLQTLAVHNEPNFKSNKTLFVTRGIQQCQLYYSSEHLEEILKLCSKTFTILQNQGLVSYCDENLQEMISDAGAKFLQTFEKLGNIPFKKTGHSSTILRDGKEKENELSELSEKARQELAQLQINFQDQKIQCEQLLEEKQKMIEAYKMKLDAVKQNVSKNIGKIM